jgi:hypothetical protein
MRTTLPIILATLAALMTACDAGPVEIPCAACDHAAPAGASVHAATGLVDFVNEQHVPFQYDLWGCGEIVSVAGIEHYMWGQGDSIPGVGRGKSIYHLRSKGTGVGLTSGSAYRFSNQVSAGANWDLSESTQSIYRSVQTFRLISLDSMPDLIVHYNVVVAVKPDGSIAVERWGHWPECP